MWAMTSFGILMPAVRPPKTVLPGDDRTMQIRARRAQDLDILRAKYMTGSLGPNLHTPDKDYEYRAYCTPHAFALAMAQMVLDIDYGKFKPTTDRYADDDLHSCYNAIWSVVLTRLSTALHRWEYWNTRPRTSSTTGYASYHGGTGYGTGHGTGYSGTGSGYAGPLERYDRGGDWAVTHWRNTGAGRDHYQPDPTLDPTLDPSPATLVEHPAADPYDAAIGAEIDGLYAEIDRLTASLERMDHGECEHAASDNARARCRRRNRRRVNTQIDELYHAIDELTHRPTDLPTDLPADLVAEPHVTAALPAAPGICTVHLPDPPEDADQRAAAPGVSPAVLAAG